MLAISDSSKVYVTGHRGLVGSAVIRKLKQRGIDQILTANRQDVDLRDPAAVDQWFKDHRPDFVVHVAGLVGGIHANRTRPADFMYDNLMIHATVLRSAWKYEVAKLLYLGSSCIYPRDCPQPIKEEYLLTGPLEPTNEAYALAKIAGLRSCEYYRTQYGCNFISAMPTNLYGPHDNFDLKSSHVLPALIRKFHEAREENADEVVIWGTGRPRREFLHVDDLADACLFLLENYDGPGTINVGSGEDIPIGDLAKLVGEIVYPEARIVYDTSMPDGTPRKLLDVSRIHQLGWKHQIDLTTGIADAYRWYCDQIAPATVSTT